MPENFMQNFFPADLTAGQVVAKLTSEISFLHRWLIESGDDYTSKLFTEKLQLLKDKIEEKEKFEKLREEEESSEEIN